MINTRNILLKRYGKVLVDGEVPKTDNKMCICCDKYAECDHVKYDGCDEYEITDKEFILKMIIKLLATRTDDDMTEIANIIEVSSPNYIVSLYNIYTLESMYDLCDNCDGHGVVIGIDIDECDKCKGIGLIRKDRKGQFIADFFNDDVMSNDNSNLTLIYVDEGSTMDDLLKDEIHSFTPAYIDSKYVSKDGEGRLSISEERFVLYDTNNNKIESIGNYYQLHKDLDLPTYMDIETILGDEYKVISENNFWEIYKIHDSSDTIVDKESYDNMRYKLLVTDTNEYQEEMGNIHETVNWYVLKYDTFESIIENIKSYLNLEDDMVISKVSLSFVKSIKDSVFDRFGLELSDLEAAQMLELLKPYLNESEINTAITDYNILSAFIVEYIYREIMYNTDVSKMVDALE